MPDISAELERDNAALRHGVASTSAMNRVLSEHVEKAESVIKELFAENEKARSEIEETKKQANEYMAALATSAHT